MTDGEREAAVLKWLDFKRQGFEVHTASDGRAALQMAADLRPDVLLLDVMMPVLTGLEAGRHLRADPRTAHAPIILYSAVVGDEMQREAEAADADLFLGKAVTHDVLVEQVRKLLETTARPGAVGAARAAASALDILTLLDVDLVWLLAAALADVRARAVSILPAQADGAPRGLLVFTSPNTVGVSPEFTRALSVVARQAGVALASQ